MLGAHYCQHPQSPLGMSGALCCVSSSPEAKAGFMPLSVATIFAVDSPNPIQHSSFGSKHGS